MAKKRTRYTVDLNPEFVKLLSSLMERRDATGAAVIRRALAVYGLIVDAEMKGWPVVIQDPENRDRDTRLVNP